MRQTQQFMYFVEHLSKDIEYERLESKNEFLIKVSDHKSDHIAMSTQMRTDYAQYQLEHNLFVWHVQGCTLI